MIKTKYWLSILAVSVVLLAGSLAVSPIAIADDDDDDDDNGPTPPPASPPPLPPYASVVAGSESVTVGSEKTTFKLTAGGVIPEEADAYILDRGSLAFVWVDATTNAVAVAIHPGNTDSEEEPWHAHASNTTILFSPFRICIESLVELGDYELEIEDDVIELEVNNFSINPNPPVTYTLFATSNNVVFDTTLCPLSSTLGLRIISPAS